MNYLEIRIAEILAELELELDCCRIDELDAEYQHISGDHILGDFTVEKES